MAINPDHAVDGGLRNDLNGLIYEEYRYWSGRKDLTVAPGAQRDSRTLPAGGRPRMACINPDHAVGGGLRNDMNGLIYEEYRYWSGREDLNLRPLAPHK